MILCYIFDCKFKLSEWNSRCFICFKHGIIHYCDGETCDIDINNTCLISGNIIDVKKENNNNNFQDQKDNKKMKLMIMEENNFIFQPEFKLIFSPNRFAITITEYLKERDIIITGRVLNSIIQRLYALMWKHNAIYFKNRGIFQTNHIIKEANIVKRYNNKLYNIFAVFDQECLGITKMLNKQGDLSFRKSATILLNHDLKCSESDLLPLKEEFSTTPTPYASKIWRKCTITP